MLEMAYYPFWSEKLSISDDLRFACWLCSSSTHSGWCCFNAFCNAVYFFIVFCDHEVWICWIHYYTRWLMCNRRTIHCDKSQMNILNSKCGKWIISAETWAFKIEKEVTVKNCGYDKIKDSNSIEEFMSCFS